MSEMLGESTISEVQLVRDSTRGPMAGPTHAQKGLFQLKLEGSQCEGGMLQVRISELLLSDGKGDEREGTRNRRADRQAARDDVTCGKRPPARRV